MGIVKGIFFCIFKGRSIGESEAVRSQSVVGILNHVTKLMFILETAQR